MLCFPSAAKARRNASCAISSTSCGLCRKRVRNFFIRFSFSRYAFNIPDSVFASICAERHRSAAHAGRGVQRIRIDQAKEPVEAERCPIVVSPALVNKAKDQPSLCAVIITSNKPHTADRRQQAKVRLSSSSSHRHDGLLLPLS